MRVLARPAFELAPIACRKLVSFRRQESCPRHVVQLVVIYSEIVTLAFTRREVWLGTYQVFRKA